MDWFDRNLLVRPMNLGDDAEDIWHVYKYVKDSLEKKMKNQPAKQKKFEVIEKEFLALYEKAKEKESEQTENRAKRPLDYFKEFTGHYSWIFRSLKWKARHHSRAHRNNY